MAHFSDRLVSANKLIIAAAVIYAGAVSLAHADASDQCLDHARAVFEATHAATYGHVLGDTQAARNVAGLEVFAAMFREKANTGALNDETRQSGCKAIEAIYAKINSDGFTPDKWESCK